MVSIGAELAVLTDALIFSAAPCVGLVVFLHFMPTLLVDNLSRLALLLNFLLSHYSWRCAIATVYTPIYCAPDEPKGTRIASKLSGCGPIL